MDIKKNNIKLKMSIIFKEYERIYKKQKSFIRKKKYLKIKHEFNEDNKLSL